MKTKKQTKVLSLLLAILMVMGVMPMGIVSASTVQQQSLSYVDENQAPKSTTEYKVVPDGPNNVTLTTGTWVVDKDLTLTGLKIEGDVNLIIADGKTLTVNSKEITYSQKKDADSEPTLKNAVASVWIDLTASLTIYGQDKQTGVLCVNASTTGTKSVYPVFGSSGYGRTSSVTVNGANTLVNVTECSSTAYPFYSKNFILNAGRVAITAKNLAGGIHDIDVYNIEINGGILTIDQSSAGAQMILYSTNPSGIGNISITGGTVDINSTCSSKFNCTGIYTDSFSMSGGTVKMDVANPNGTGRGLLLKNPSSMSGGILKANAKGSAGKGAGLIYQSAEATLTVTGGYAELKGSDYAGGVQPTSDITAIPTGAATLASGIALKAGADKASAEAVSGVTDIGATLYANKYVQIGDITAWYTKAAAGVGNTKENPYLIHNTAELEGLASLVNENKITFENKFIKLADDFDGKDALTTPIGIDDETYFSGAFDGNNKTVALAVIGRSTDVYAGLFGYISALTSAVENVYVTGNILMNGCSTSMIVGGIAGNMLGKAITNCSSSVSVTATSDVDKYSTRCGGICGVNNSVHIQNCYATGSLNIAAKSNIVVGGIAGTCYMAEVTNCYSLCDISAKSTSEIWDGGILGINNSTSSTVKNSYAKQTKLCGVNDNLDTTNGTIDTATKKVGSIALLDLLNAYAKGENGVAAGCKPWKENSSVNNGFPVFAELVAEVNFGGEIGVKKYYAIDDALAAIGAGTESQPATGTVKLIADNKEDVTIGEFQEIILDLNGYKLENDKELNTIINNGILSVIDLSTDKTGEMISRNTAIFNRSTGELTVSDIKIIVGIKPDSKDSSGITNEGVCNIQGDKMVISSTGPREACCILNRGGIITVAEGKFTSGSSNYNSVFTTTNNNVTIGKDAEFILGNSTATEKYAYYSSVNNTISAGKFSGPVVAGTGKTITITGGSFTENPTDMVNSDTHKVVDNGNTGAYRYTVKEKADTTISAPTTITKKCDGSALTGTASPAVTTGSNVTYQTKTTADGQYSAESNNVPSLTDAGTLYVKAIARHADYKTVSVEYTLTVTEPYDVLFEHKKQNTITELEEFGNTHGNPISKHIVKKGVKLIGELTYDESKSYEENCSNIEKYQKNAIDNVTLFHNIVYKCPFLGFFARLLQPLFSILEKVY